MFWFSFFVAIFVNATGVARANYTFKSFRGILCLEQLCKYYNRKLLRLWQLQLASRILPLNEPSLKSTNKFCSHLYLKYEILTLWKTWITHIYIYIYIHIYLNMRYIYINIYKWEFSPAVHLRQNFFIDTWLMLRDSNLNVANIHPIYDQSS